MELSNSNDQQPQEQKQKVSWTNVAYQRIPWLRVKYGQRVLPQNQQRSNLSLADEQVLQRRDEPLTSFAFSLNGSADISDGQAGAKR